MNPNQAIRTLANAAHVPVDQIDTVHIRRGRGKWDVEVAYWQHVDGENVWRVVELPPFPIVEGVAS